MHTFEDLFAAYQSLNGYGWNMWQKFVPPKYDKLIYAYWNGGSIHPENVLKCLLNGWFFDMKEILETNPEAVKKMNAYYGDFRYWIENCKDDDDDTSDELFNAIINNHKAELQKIKDEAVRQKEMRRQRKFYKSVRLLRTDIDKLLPIVEKYADANLYQRIKEAFIK